MSLATGRGLTVGVGGPAQSTRRPGGGSNGLRAGGRQRTTLERGMVRFLDGPAAGVDLLLLRAPLFLRVTRRSLEWDALDQFDDLPGADEEIIVYRRDGPPGWLHIYR